MSSLGGPTFKKLFWITCTLDKITPFIFLLRFQVFGDPCPGTHKYVEIHYACVSQFAGPASSKSSTPRLPPWLLEGGASNLW